MKWRIAAMAGLALLTGIFAAGCAADAAADGPVAWEEPAWMAQYRLDMEAWQLEEIACYARHGVEVTPKPSGGIGLPFINLDVEGPEVWEHIESAMWACVEEVELISWWQGPLDEAVYERMLDSRDCLIAHGYEVPEPPSFEVWQQGNGMWFPHQEAFNARRFAGIGLNQAEWAELNELCPQPGPNTFSWSVAPVRD